MRFSLIIILISILLGCNDNEVQGEYIPPVASHFPLFPKQELNPLTKKGIALGKKLFYDPILSKNESVSCASCHQQQYAFGENIPLSTLGVSHQFLKRNSPPLINLAWQSTFFWEGGSTSLEIQALGPLTHHDEMSKDLNTLLEDLRKDKTYIEMFENAFGSDTINLRKVAYALAQFQKTLISDDSRYDRMLQQQVEFNSVELKGYKLFQTHCSACHQEVMMTDHLYHNNGLDSSFSYPAEDPRWGRYRVTLDSNDVGKYKTPTLRNIAFSSPYMHDGRFQTLDEVIEHYSEGIMVSPTVELSSMGFKDEEKRALKSFLLTLSDSSFIKNKSYQKDE